MLSETWQTVNRLLLLCHFDTEALMGSKSVFRVLHQALPQTEIALLVFHESDRIAFELFKINKEVKTLLTPHFSGDSLKKSIKALKESSFDAAIVFTNSYQSPYALAYLCYLANIPIRIGQSQEFGGGVLSTCITPPIENVSLPNYHLHLLRSAGIPILVNSE